MLGYPGYAYVMGGPAFSGIGEEWTNVIIDLSNKIGHHLMIAFAFQSDFSVNYQGAAVDDIVIEINPPQIVGYTIPHMPPNFIGPVGPVSQPDMPLSAEIARVVVKTDAYCREGTNRVFNPVSIFPESESTPIKAMKSDQSWYSVYDASKDLFCWIWAEVVDVLGDTRNVTILPDPIPPVSPPDAPSEDDEPVCSESFTTKEKCEATGGTWNLGSAPPCKCP